MKKPTADKTSKQHCILVVDSDEKINLQIQKELHGAGYDVTGVLSGKDASDAIAGNPDAVLLLNYKLADINGRALIKSLKHQRPNIPFIIMIDSHEEKKAAMMIRHGAREYLVKEPGFLDILPALIEKTVHELKLELKLTELKEALRQSEQKYDFVFENANMPMAILGKDGILLIVNNAFVKLCGYTKKEIEGKLNWKKFVFQEDLKRVETPYNLNAAAPGISLMNYEFRLANKQNRNKDIVLTINIISDSPWKIASFLDVSAMRQTEKALQQSEKQFQSLIKNIPGIVYLCYYDKDWTMHYMVKEVERISGYPASDFINNNVRSYTSIIHPDDVSLVERTIEEGVANNKPYEMEYRLIRKDGNIVWVYEKGQKVCSQDNKIWLNGIIFDITGRKQIEIALDIATREWQVTFDAIPNAVFLLNRERCIVKCNHAAEKLLDRKRKDVIGQYYYEVIDNMSESSSECLYRRMLKSRRRESAIRPLGKKTVELTIIPIINPGKEIYGSVLLIVDITKLKETENKLEDQKKELQSIFHTAPIGMGVVSKRVFIQVNEQMCRIMGYTKNELIGQDAKIFYSSDDEYKRVGADYEKTEGRKIAVVTTKLKRKDGRVIDALLHFSPLNTDINGFTFTLTNISKK